MIIGPPEGTQGFSKIWPIDLVLDLTWYIFQLVWDFIKTKILTKFHDNQAENVASRAYTRVFFFKISSSDLFFYQTRPIFKFIQDLMKKNILSFMTIRLKMWPLEHTLGFCKILPIDLIIDLTWPIFELSWDFIKTNILTMFHDNWSKNMASRAYTSLKVDDAWRTQHYHNSSLSALRAQVS